MATAVAMALPLSGNAAGITQESNDLCVGLECDLPASGLYVPEAHGAVPAVADLDDLRRQKKSGFYRLPALVYRTDAQPQAVVYLAKAGDSEQMPDSVRNLPAVRDAARTSGAAINAMTMVVVDHGISLTFATGPVAGAARRAKARAAQLHYTCPERYFCVFKRENLDYNISDPVARISGPMYWGTGWHNFGTNFGSSMVNDRGGDSLLADHGLGTGTRYCARQYSLDYTFSNNAIGNDNASSWALLGSTPDRC